MKTSDCMREAMRVQGISPAELLAELRGSGLCCGREVEAVEGLVEGGPCKACIAMALIAILVRQRHALRH